MIHNKRLIYIFTDYIMSKTAWLTLCASGVFTCGVVYYVHTSQAKDREVILGSRDNPCKCIHPSPPQTPLRNSIKVLFKAQQYTM